VDITFIYRIVLGKVRGVGIKDLSNHLGIPTKAQVVTSTPLATFTMEGKTYTKSELSELLKVTDGYLATRFSREKFPPYITIYNESRNGTNSKIPKKFVGVKIYKVYDKAT